MKTQVFGKNVRIDLNININDRIKQAQNRLDSAVIEDSTPLVPIRHEVLRNSALMGTVLGSGQVTWKTPYAHYMYIGDLYVNPKTGKECFYNPVTGRMWSRPKVAKIKSDRKLVYAQGGPQWFEKAKAIHKKEWVDIVGRTLEGK